MANLFVLRETNFIPPMHGVVWSESIQYNRVGSKDLNFVDMSRKSISDLIFKGGFRHTCVDA